MEEYSELSSNKFCFLPLNRLQPYKFCEVVFDDHEKPHQNTIVILTGIFLIVNQINLNSITKPSRFDGNTRTFFTFGCVVVDLYADWAKSNEMFDLVFGDVVINPIHFVLCGSNTFMTGSLARVVDCIKDIFSSTYCFVVSFFGNIIFKPNQIFLSNIGPGNNTSFW